VPCSVHQSQRAEDWKVWMSRARWSLGTPLVPLVQVSPRVAGGNVHLVPASPWRASTHRAPKPNIIIVSVSFVDAPTEP